MARVALPQSKIKQRRKQRRIRIAIFIAGVAILLLGGIAGASWIPAVRISEVRVQGVQVASVKEVAQFVEDELKGRVMLVFPKNSIFLYPKDIIAEKLQATFPALHSARIRARVPSNFHAITVSVDQREPHALWCGEATEEACAFVDSGGIVYARAPEFSDAVYARYIGAAESIESGATYPKQFLTPQKFTALSALVKALGHEVGPIDRVIVSAEEDVKLLFVNGFYILFSAVDDGGDVFERFTIARGSEPLKGRSLSDFLYLDLRFGDKLYYKLKTE